MVYNIIKTSGIDPRYDIYYFFDNIFILYLILSPQMITPGLDLSTDVRGTENCNSVPVGTEFQKYRSIYPACLYKLYTLFPHDE